jgi:alkaline phosphatase D
VFTRILETDPQLVVFGGDIVYNDIKHGPFPVFSPAPVSAMQKNYQKRKTGVEYAALWEAVPIVGVWDDHDYGLNDAGGELAFKEASRKLFLEFLDEPEDSPRFSRNGIFVSYTLGSGAQSVKLILLDGRFNRTKGGDNLGAEQWAWLEEELAEEVTLKFVVSGVQVLVFDRPLQEKFSQPFANYERLAQLLAPTSGVILLSGDIHMSSFFKSKCGLSYEITEFTSSGLTHSLGDTLLTSALKPFVNTLFKSQFEVVDAFADKSFGLISIDWKTRQVNMSVIDLQGRVQRTMLVEIDQLKPTFPASFASCEKFRSAVYAVHYSQVVVGVATTSAAVFGICLGIYMYCSCRRARLKEQEKME